MPWTVDLLVLQEDTVALPGTHEVVVTGARGEAAAHRGPWPLTLLTALSRKHTETSRNIIARPPSKFKYTARICDQSGVMSYQLFSPENSHVNILQRPIVVLKHLSRPESTVHVGPLILTNVQQPAALLQHIRTIQMTFSSVKASAL